jgi:hypothetical protein
MGWINRRKLRRQFDPIALHDAIVQAGVLPAAKEGQGPSRNLGDNERFFTEGDERLWALWRISMVRDLQAPLLEALARTDLLFLAGQTPTGYNDTRLGLGDIAIEANKVSQNAERARIELDRRARRFGYWQGLAAVAIGAALALAGQALIEESDTRSSPPTTSTPTP